MNDRTFDVWAGTYAYACDYHNGQGSALYALGCRMQTRGYIPGLHVCNGHLEPDEQAEYDRLVARRYATTR